MHFSNFHYYYYCCYIIIIIIIFIFNIIVIAITANFNIVISPSLFISILFLCTYNSQFLKIPTCKFKQLVFSMLILATLAFGFGLSVIYWTLCCSETELNYHYIYSKRLWEHVTRNTMFIVVALLLFYRVTSNIPFHWVLYSSQFSF